MCNNSRNCVLRTAICNNSRIYVLRSAMCNSRNCVLRIAMCGNSRNCVLRTAMCGNSRNCVLRTAMCGNSRNRVLCTAMCDNSINRVVSPAMCGNFRRWGSLMKYGTQMRCFSGTFLGSEQRPHGKGYLSGKVKNLSSRNHSSVQQPGNPLNPFSQTHFSKRRTRITISPFVINFLKTYRM